ncbi:MAG: zinc ABC transporter solute-binding protein [Clostridiaceae bacterium]|nr:zinc ABC transporter solute-binding protein [Clostridiaceae bacterium]
MKVAKSPILFIMAALFGLIIVACSSQTYETSNKLTIAVSIVPQETFVKEVAGDLVDVVTIIPPGKSPANYAPAPREIEKLSRADIYFTIDVPTEQSSILPKLKELNSDIRIVDMADEVKKHFPEKELSPGQRDPHIWLSPKRAAVMVESMASELSNIDSKNSDIYKKNASNYIEKLKVLDKEVASLFDKLKNKTFIMYHPSLGYFADDYNLSMLSIQTEGKDAAPNDMQRVIDIAKKQEVKTVFYQTEIDSRQSQVLASEIGGKVVSIAPLSPEYISSLKKIAAEIYSSCK